MLNSMDVVQREEFEAVREMALKARAENKQLEARLAALECAARHGASRRGRRGVRSPREATAAHFSKKIIGGPVFRPAWENPFSVNPLPGMRSFFVTVTIHTRDAPDEKRAGAATPHQ